MSVTNERIALFILATLVVIIGIAYLHNFSVMEKEIMRYRTLFGILNMADPHEIRSEIEMYLIKNLNITSNTNLTVKYIGIANDLFQYNITLNKSWDYVYTTMDGAYLFIPYKPTPNTLYFSVVPLTINSTKK